MIGRDDPTLVMDHKDGGDDFPWRDEFHTQVRNAQLQGRLGGWAVVGGVCGV